MTRGEFICYFSGFSSSRLKKLLYFVENGMPIKAICSNYLDIYSMKDKGRYINYAEKLVDDYGVRILMDSGAYPILYAFDYLNGNEVRTVRSVNGDARRIVENNLYDEVIDEYIRFIKEYNLFEHYVEFDLQKIVGNERVWKWRDKFVKNDLMPMIVIHDFETQEEIDRMVEFADDSIGFSGPRNTRDTVFLNKIKQMEYVRNKKKLWQHFFAFGEMEWINSFVGRGLINSSDNTSWINSTAWGRQYIFDKEAGTMRLLSVGRIFRDEGWLKRMMLIRNRFEECYDELIEYGFNVDKMEELFMKGRFCDEWNWFSLLEFQKFYNYLNSKEGRKRICGSVLKTQTLDNWFK